jgi:hypothetical protein
MDRRGRQLLAGAALAGDQHGSIGRRDAADQLEELEKARLGADQGAEVEAAVQLLAAHRCPLGLCLVGERQRGLDRLHELGVRPGLGDEIGRARLHPLDRQRDRSPGGDQDHRQPRPQLADRGEQLQPLLARSGAREVHVLEHQVDLLLAQHGQSLLLRPGRPRGMAVPLEEEAQGGHHRRVVVDDKDHRSLIIRSVAPRPAAPAPPGRWDTGCRGWR